MRQDPGQAGAVIPRPALTIPAAGCGLCRCSARLPEMFEGMQAAFDDARAEDSVVPIHLFYRE